MEQNKHNNNGAPEKQGQPSNFQGNRHNRYNRRRKPVHRDDRRQQSSAEQRQAGEQKSSSPSQPRQGQHQVNSGKHAPNNAQRPRTQQNSRPRQERSAEQNEFITAPQNAVKYEAPPEVIFIEEPITEPPTKDIMDGKVKDGDPDFDAFDFTEQIPAVTEDGERVEIVGVRFRKAGKIYFFAPADEKFARGENVVVETARGPEFGEVWTPNRDVGIGDIVQPLRPVLRRATEEDAAHNEQNRAREKEAFAICREKIAKHGLEMKLVEAQYTFDNSKLLFYFTSAGRVDFRELVKDLASVFRTRIELRQIGIRDEAKLLGGLGVCGRSLCCAGFLSDFVQVSIKMAKEQNLSLNSNKISGSCGRLMCCLRYENDIYEEEIRKTPPVDSQVKTPDGVGVITEINPLAGTVKVKIVDGKDVSLKVHHRDNITVLSRPAHTEDEKDESK